MNRLLSIFLVSLMSLSLMGQTDRPKVGLVLSGGSAHGLAHIGVLKMLEEQGVHIDYVTGTSMGSIIGGLFAMGLSADEIEALTEEQNWAQLLSTNVPLKEIAPSEKLYHDRYGLTLEIRKDGIKLPQGFLNSQKLDLQLNRMFCPAHDIDDFNNLAYPFKCVAVNIENGDVEVLDRGYLGTAVRSSMAIPSVFAPVEMDGKLLVDGGLIRNFPVEEVQAMGADIVIGVYVGSKLENKSKLNNLLEILNQSAFMMGVLDSDEQKKKVDILIEPDVKDFASFGFDLSKDLVREGYISAMAQLDDIEALGLAQKSYTTVTPEALQYIDSVDLASTRFPFIREPFDELANFKYGHLKKKGHVELERIERGITRIFGTKHFDNINYTFQTNSRGEKILNVLAKPRKVNTMSGTFNFMPSSSTSLILTNELRNVIDEPSVLYTTVRIAENYGVKMDYNYRLGNKKDFILNVLSQVHRYDQNLYESEILRERYAETKATASIGVGYEPNNEVLIKGTAGIDGYGFRPVGLDDEGLERYRRFDATMIGEIVYDNIDDIQFPNNGIRIGISGGLHNPLNSQLKEGNQNPIYIPGNELYIDGHVKGKAVRSLTPRIAVIGGIAAGIKTQESLTDNYRVGGLEDRDYKSISMIGLNTHQIHMSQFFRGSAEIRWQMFGSFYTTLRADYLSGTQTFVLKDLNEDLEKSLWGYGAIMGLKTPLGPMRFAYGRNSLTESWNTNFTFGYTFF